MSQGRLYCTGPVPGSFTYAFCYSATHCCDSSANRRVKVDFAALAFVSVAVLCLRLFDNCTITTQCCDSSANRLVKVDFAALALSRITLLRYYVCDYSKLYSYDSVLLAAVLLINDSGSALLRWPLPA
ncbi:hypothetical protein J6590_009831 [Homalodisca vitripennis]|nr:hypothetical protein J6590_009831 [Homalodisca vitripennis]